MSRRSTRRAAATPSVPYADYGGDDGEEDDDEGDWDEDALVDDDDEDSLEDDDEDLDTAPPTFFHGHLHKDGQGQLLYQDDKRSFIFRSTKPLQDSWSLHNPLTKANNSEDDEPIILEWIHPPHHSSRGRFDLTICKLESKSLEDDALQQKLLKAQEDDDGVGSDGKMPAVSQRARLKGDDCDDDQEKPKASNLKEPPSYSAKQPPTTELKSLKKQPPSSSGHDDGGTSYLDILCSVAGRERDNGIVKGDDLVEFRGVFRAPANPTANKLCLICSVKVVPKTSIAKAVAGSSKPPPAAAAASSAAPAVARKRSRDTSAANDDDDVDDNAEEGVEFNELIGLHEDANLTPEQLRAKYYGGGDHGKPNSYKRQKSMEEDDDDSDVGF